MDGLERFRLYSDQAHGMLWPLIEVNGKTPIRKDWVNGPRMDPEAWEQRLRGYRGNLGLLTGMQRSGGCLVVIDVDTAKVPDAEESFYRLRMLGLPYETVTVITGSGGWHVYVWSPVPVKKGPLAGFPGIDIQAEGAFVVVPPSEHPETHNPYCFEFGYDLEHPIARLPDSLIELFNSGGRAHDWSTDVAAGLEIQRTVELLTDHFGAHNATVSANGVVRLTRPDKSHGISMTVGALVDPGAAYCWSSNWPPFVSGKAYEYEEVRALAGIPPQPLGNIRVAEPSPWDDEHEPLVPDLERPPFPTEVLGPLYGRYVEEVAAALQVPTDLVGCLVLGALSLVSTGHLQVEAWPGFVESTNLYLVVLMRSGERKSPTFARVLSPIVDYEDELAAGSIEAVKQAQLSKREHETRSKQAAADAMKTKDPEAQEHHRRVASEEALEASAIDVPQPPRLYTQDATPEALAQLLSDHAGRMGLFSDEGGPLESSDRYSSKPNLDVYLQGYSGGAIRVDRKGQPPLMVKRALITMVVTAQPVVLHDFVSRSFNVDRGLFARMQAVIPHSMIGHRLARGPEVSPALEAEYATDLIYRAKELARWGPLTARFNVDGIGRLTAFADELESMVGDGQPLDYMADHVNKLTGLWLRLAGILHVIEREPREWNLMVSESVQERAELLTRWFLRHAEVTRGFLARPRGATDLEHAYRWGLTRHPEPFTARDLQAGSHRFRERGAALAALQELERRGAGALVGAQAERPRKANDPMGGTAP